MSPMGAWLVLAASALLGQGPQPGQAQGAAAGGDGPLRVFLRAGPKTHGEGEHDHPRFLLEWKRLLGERGARVEGDLRFPTAAELARADVLVLYAAEGASIHAAEREALDAFRARGGGLVVLHDAVCGDDPQWFRTVAGGAWEHGHARWHTGRIGLYFSEAGHPITAGAANFDLDDEIYYRMHFDEDARVLASSFHTPFDVTPQMWVLERGASRSFVALQGHYHSTFSHPAWRALLLRGIAWAGRREVDLLTSAEERSALAYPPGGPTPPDRAHEGFELHPDFVIELAAAEPLVVNPISIDWDARGRAWVALTPGYPFKQESSGIPAHDEVAILEDQDGDGRFDAKRVFHSGLDLVTSLVMHREGVIVSASPRILYLGDSDGDDVADVVETLYEGFGYGDTHAVLSNLRWGIDGWIYATQGYSGGQSRDVRGRDGFGSVPNGLLRFRPDGSAVELVSSYASNTWGLDFAPDGELFFTMANGSHLRHVVMSEGDLARARVGEAASWKDVADHHEVRRISSDDRAVYQQIDFVGGFTAASGCCFYDGASWPAEFFGNHFVCEPSVNLVHRDVLRPAGTSFVASRPEREEFLASRDLWFRPVHLRVGPGGALWLLDFYNQAVVHNDTRGPEHGPTNAAVRPDRDSTHGRVWRIRHRAAQPLAVPRLDRADASALVRALSQPNPWVRHTAQRLLRERSDPATVAPLAALLDNAREDQSEAARVHALWLLEDLSTDVGGRASRIAAALRRGETERRHALRLAARYGTSASGVLLVERLVEAAMSPFPRERLLALVALAHYDLDAAASRRLASLYGLLEDDWTRSALVGALLGDADGGLRAALERAAPKLAAELAGQVARKADPAELTACLAALAESRAPAQILTPALLALRDRARAGAAAAETPVLEAALAALLGREEVEIGITALAFVPDDPPATVSEPAADLAARLAVAVADEDEPVERRLAALAALLRRPEGRAAALAAGAELLAPRYASEVHLAVIAALGRLEQVQAAQVLAEAWPSLAHAAREAAFEQLVARPGWAQTLLAAVEAGAVESADLGPLRRHRLENHPDAPVAERARAALGARERPEVAALVASLLPEVVRPGDPERGATLFAENCASCHSLNGGGGRVGPDLTGIGAHGVEALLPVVLDPSREVDPAYLDYVVRTVDGRLLTGVVARESRDSILLVNASGEVEVAREEVEEMRSTGLSPMPAGFESLGARGLRDLFAYIVRGYEGYRVLDLSAVANASTAAGLYDPERDPNRYRFARRGVLEVEGVPFEVLDPERAAGGFDALVLGGGPWEQWATRGYARAARITIGFPVARVHVLGGVAAWGHPWGATRGAPAVRWTWVYDDGQEESVELLDGQHFADWIGRHDVPGSDFVGGLLAPDSAGQLRRFALAPGRAQSVSALRLESFGNHLAPTFLALTAELPDAGRPASAQEGSARAADGPPTPFLLFGGGSSHDFERWFDREDRATLSSALDGSVDYCDRPRELLERLPALRVLALSCNQELPGPDLRSALFEHVDGGGGLFLIHASTWRNWPDWPAFNAELVGGGTRSHEDYGRIRVEITSADHPALAGVPASFEVEDELYRFEPDARAALEVLAVGTSAATGASYPVVWTVERGAGRILCTSLGHDGGAHGHEAYRALLRSGFRWLDPGR